MAWAPAARCWYAAGFSLKVLVVASKVTPAGRGDGSPTTERVVPASTSEAFARAESVDTDRSSVATPVTPPVTTGASFSPLTVHETDAGTRLPATTRV
jgi:hypothetical protein